MTNASLWGPWLVLAGYAALIFVITPRAVTATQFFGGGSRTGTPPGPWLLGASAAISWVMAKSVYNAMALSAQFGLIGGIGYGAYWLSFIVVGVAVYFMRTRGGYSSLAQFLRQKYGATAMRLFMIVIAFRLFNEIWSNTKVTSQFFGAEGSTGYWIAAVVITGFTVGYSLRGGLRSSILTDAVQTLLLAVLLVCLLATITPSFVTHGVPVPPGGSYTPAMRAGGLTFLGLALVQSLSYGFHDPVMTDRAFVARPAAMLRAFIIACVLGGGFITLFSLAGVYAWTTGGSADTPVPVAVAATIGLWMSLLFNAVMLTSAGSTLDSTFSSVAKFSARDWSIASDKPAPRQVRRGRRAMLVLALLGNLPLLSLYIKGVGPAVIAATTVSGTAVMGLAPVFLLGWLRHAGRLSFYLAFYPGLALGLLKALDSFTNLDVFPTAIDIGRGPYAQTLGINAWGVAICTLGFLIGVWLTRASISRHAITVSQSDRKRAETAIRPIQ